MGKSTFKSLQLAIIIIFILNLSRQSQARWLYFGSSQDDTSAQPSTVLPTTSKPHTVSDNDGTDTILRVERNGVEVTTNPTLQSPPPSKTSSNFLVTFVMGYLSNGIKFLLLKIGNYVPLKGVASIAADLGIPGGEYIMDALSHQNQDPSPAPFKPYAAPQGTEGRQPSAMPINPRFSAWAGPHDHAEEEPVTPATSYREEVSSIMGTMFGERQCLMKLACLSGKRLSSVRGASAVTMVLSTMAGVMPEGLQDPYHALKNSMMYTDDCSQYECKEEQNPEL